MEKEAKAIIFDIGGILQLDKYSENSIDRHRLLGIHEKIAKRLKIFLDQYFDSTDTTYAKSIEGKISEKRALNEIAKNLKISVQQLRTLFIGTYKKYFKFNKQLFKQVLKYKKQGYKIAILSDQWYLSKEVLFNSKLKKNFNLTIISCDIRLRKPNPKIYRLILKKLELPAKSCLFIDDQEWNIKAAKKLGMKIILFKNNKQLFKRLEKLDIK